MGLPKRPWLNPEYEWSKEELYYFLQEYEKWAKDMVVELEKLLDDEPKCNAEAYEDTIDFENAHLDWQWRCCETLRKVLEALR